MGKVFDGKVIAYRRIAARLASAFLATGFTERDLSALQRDKDDPARDAEVQQVRLDLQGVARGLAMVEWAGQIRHRRGKLRPTYTKPLMVRAAPVYNEEIWRLVESKVRKLTKVLVAGGG